jgi:Asp-tRNAAsn/Glu-tRNAGln amidotransferase A subunit and related amidases
MGAAELAREIRAGQLSPVEVFDAYQSRIAEANPFLNAIVTMNDDARKAAETAASDIVKKRRLGPLHGVPFTVKDSFDTAGVRTTRGSKLFATHIPAKDATVVNRLREAGGILIGKTNLPEFCLGVETENRVFGRTVNPWDLERTPGGSSGGEASAIAAGMSALGVGADQGGSVRLPAHYTGIVGFKPTLGRIPMTGHMPDTLHQYATAGVMARYVDDVRLALEIASGADGADWQAEVPDSSVEPRAIDSLRVGWIAGDYFGTIEDDIADAVRDAAEQLGGSVGQLTQLPQDFMPEFDCDLLSEGLFRAEGAEYFKPILAGHEDELHPWMHAELGRAIRDLPDYLAAAAGVGRLRAALHEFFREFDVLLCPVAPIVAPMCGSDHIVVKGVERRLRSVNRAVQPFNLTGVPALSLPYAMSSDALPIGVQIVGRKYEERNVLTVAEHLESLRPGGRRLPSSSVV